MVTLGTAFGTAPIASPEDFGQAMSALHATAEAWLDVMEGMGWQGTGGAFFEALVGVRGDDVVHPTFLWAKELLLGDGRWLWRTEPGEPEVHVDRTLNVWGSGGAHAAYFSDLDEVVKNVFNQPLEDQPQGLCDMGCGNGALLLHLKEVVATLNPSGAIWRRIRSC